MSDQIKATELPAADPITGDEIFYLVQGGTSKQSTLSSIGANDTLEQVLNNGSTTGSNDITFNNQTASTAAVFDSSKKLISSPTTSTELGFVHGVTSNIQTQLNDEKYGKSWKQACRVATTGDQGLTGFSIPVDGISIQAGDRVLVWQQGNPIENGIYVVGSGLWTRAEDFNNKLDNLSAACMAIQEGSTYANQIFICTNVEPVNVGTSNITFQQFTSGGGTPTLTQNLIGVGDASNLLSSYSNFNYDGSKLGVGTTTPTATVHVVNPSGTSASDFFVVEGSTANNSHYPTILLKGGTLVTDFPNIMLENGGIAVVLNSGVYIGNQCTFAADADVGMYVLLNKSGTPYAPFLTSMTNQYTLISPSNVISSSATPLSPLTVVGSTCLGTNAAANETLDVRGNVTYENMYSHSATPTVSLNATVFGIGATLNSVVGNNQCGLITATSGTGSFGNGELLRITLNSFLAPNGISGFIVPADQVTALAYGTQPFYYSSSTNVFIASIGNSGIGAVSTTYSWFYSLSFY